MPFAYIIYFNETAGAVLIMLGLFTRFAAASISIQFFLITFLAHFGNGYGWTNPRGGWEFPLMWGMIFFAIALRGGDPIRSIACCGASYRGQRPSGTRQRFPPRVPQCIQIGARKSLCTTAK